MCASCRYRADGASCATSTVFEKDSYYFCAFPGSRPIQWGLPELVLDKHVRAILKKHAREFHESVGRRLMYYVVVSVHPRTGPSHPHRAREGCGQLRL